MYKKSKFIDFEEKKKQKKNKLEVKSLEKDFPEASGQSKTTLKISIKKKKEKNDEVQELRENIILKLHRLRKEFFLRVDLINSQETGLSEESKKAIKEKILNKTLETSEKLSYDTENVHLMLDIYSDYKKSIEKLVKSQKKVHLKVV